ncbi:MAG: hypothetical protein FJY54_14385 [Betaproteobacteria bacterium]|nr:hypothetical protein [Betaproteobacteria bacterium]
MTEKTNKAFLVPLPLWKLAWIAVAAAYAWPVVSIAYDRAVGVTRQARERLIVQHRLWELHPEYYGTAETWTRAASRVLSDRQLMSRVHSKYGNLATQIELDYRRDLFIARAEVFAVALLAWGLPVGALYGIGLTVVRVRRRPAPQASEPVADDTRYRP